MFFVTTVGNLLPQEKKNYTIKYEHYEYLSQTSSSSIHSDHAAPSQLFWSPNSFTILI